MTDVDGGESFADVLERARLRWEAEPDLAPAPAIQSAISTNLVRGLGDMEEREQFNADRKAARTQMRDAVERALKGATEPLDGDPGHA